MKIQIETHMLIDYPNYGVTKTGEVYNLKSGRKRKTSYWLGYERIHLSKKGKKKTFWVHRLIAETFIGKSKLKQEVNHKDGNRANNRIENLEWVTRSENQKHSYTFLGKKSPMQNKLGKLHPKSKTLLQIENKNLIKKWGSFREAGRNGFTLSEIRKVLSGIKNSYKGYEWKYE